MKTKYYCTVSLLEGTAKDGRKVSSDGFKKMLDLPMISIANGTVGSMNLVEQKLEDHKEKIIEIQSKLGVSDTHVIYFSNKKEGQDFVTGKIPTIYEIESPSGNGIHAGNSVKRAVKIK